MTQIDEASELMDEEQHSSVLQDTLKPRLSTRCKMSVMLVSALLGAVATLAVVRHTWTAAAPLPAQPQAGAGEISDGTGADVELFDNYFGHTQQVCTSCNCGWATQPGACNQRDGSRCNICCCAGRLDGFDDSRVRMETRGADTDNYHGTVFNGYSDPYYHQHPLVQDTLYHDHVYHQQTEHVYHDLQADQTAYHQQGAYRIQPHRFAIGQTAYVKGRQGGWWPATVLDYSGGGVYHVKYHMDHHHGRTYLVHEFRMKHSNPQVFSPLIWALIVLGGLIALAICATFTCVKKEDLEKFKDSVRNFRLGNA